MMKTITKFMTLCALFVGVNVSAQTTVLYERGYETEWSESDLEKWTSSSVIDTKEIVDNNLHFKVGNRGYEIVCGESITSDATSVIEWTGSWKLTNVAYGYGFIKLGDIELRADRSASKGTVVIGGVETVFGLNKTELQDGAIWNYSFKIDKARGSVSYTIDLPSSEDVVGTGNTVNALTSLSVGFVKSKTCGTEFSIISIKLTETKQEVETASYAVKFVDGNGVDIKEAETRTGVVDAGINIIPTDKESFFNSDKTKKYIYVSDDSEGKTIASDGSTVVTVTYREAETYSCSVKSSTDVVLAEGSNFEGEIFNYSYPKYLTDANGKVTHKIDGLTTFSASVVLSENTDIQVPYTEYIGEAYYVEVEDKVSGTVGNNSKLSKGGAVRAFDPVLVFTVPFDGIFSIEYGAYTNNVNHESYFVLNDGEADVWTSQNVQKSINYYEVFIDEGITFAKGKELTLSSLSTNPYIDYMLFVVSKNTPISDINADKAVDNDYYDLSGRKVVNPVKGNIYINGGKLIRY